MNLRITISDGASPALQSAMRSLTGQKLSDLNRAAGRKVQELTRDHIAALRRNPDSLASKFGAPPSNFYAQASEKVAGDAALNADRSGATLAINSIGFKRAFQAGYEDFSHLEKDRDLLNLFGDAAFQEYYRGVKPARGTGKRA